MIRAGIAIVDSSIVSTLAFAANIIAYTLVKIGRLLIVEHLCTRFAYVSYT